MFVHEGQTVEEKLMAKENLEDLASELAAMPGTFAGCVHSCCELDTIDETVQLVKWGREVLGGKLYVSFGIHPSNFEELNPDGEAKLNAAIAACGPQVVAWGECGLDYYHREGDDEKDEGVKAGMKDAFARQAVLAVERGLPLVVHSRDAEEDTLAVLRSCLPRGHPVHLHSFMGSVATMQAFLEQWPNGCVGIAGAISYEGSDQPGGLHDIARALPLDRILLETDGPYMAPNPFRGEESHPGHIPWIAESVAKAKGNVSVAEVLAAVHQNFRRMYRL